MTETLHIALAQINPTVGDIDGNLALIRRRRAEAAALGADLVVTTELSVTGYPPEDLVLKPAFLARARTAVEALARDTADGGPGLVVGAPWLEDGDGGLALGVDSGPRFEKVLEEREIQLHPGDLFLQFTDGVAEATNTEKEQFGEDRIRDCLIKYGKGSVRYVIDVIQEHLKDFTREAEIEDDITFVGLRVVK